MNGNEARYNEPISLGPWHFVKGSAVFKQIAAEISANKKNRIPAHCEYSFGARKVDYHHHQTGTLDPASSVERLISSFLKYVCPHTEYLFRKQKLFLRERRKCLFIYLFIYLFLRKTIFLSHQVLRTRAIWRLVSISLELKPDGTLHKTSSTKICYIVIRP